MTIVWPQECDVTKHWPESRGKTDLGGDPRSWKTLDALCQAKHGVTLSSCIEALGGPTPRTKRGWSWRSAHDLVRSHHQTTGKRPAQNLGPEWSSLDAWLRKRGSSLRMLCDSLKLTGARKLDRSRPGIEGELRKYAERHGKCPSTHTSLTWMGHNKWLVKHEGLTLSKLVEHLDLRGKIMKDKNREAIVTAYRNLTGRTRIPPDRQYWTLCDPSSGTRGNTVQPSPQS